MYLGVSGQYQLGMAYFAVENFCMSLIFFFFCNAAAFPKNKNRAVLIFLKQLKKHSPNIDNFKLNFLNRLYLFK